MALSRKRKKELKRLRSAATDLWDDQREILEHASRVVREAAHHAAGAGQDVAPRVRDAIDTVRPGIASAADSAKDRFGHDVLPAVSSALASALAVLEVTKDPRVREAMSRVGKTGSALGSKAGIGPSKSGPGRYILIGLGLVAVAGVAYAAWQTLRADDELWVSDEANDPES